MAIDTLTVELILDDDGKFSARLINAGKGVKSFEKTVERTGRSVDRMSKRMHGALATTRDWILVIGQARNALHQIRFLTTDWIGTIVKSNAEIQRMTFLLAGMSKEAGELEKALDAEKTVGTLFDFARTAPFSIGAITDAFVKMRSVGIEPLTGELQALIDGVAAFGGTDQTLKRAAIAIQQMGGKGVISMEELRQQLGEAVPQAINLMARSMGVSFKSLVDEISKGNVAAKPALNSMFEEFNRTFGGRAQDLMESFSGQLAVMATNLIALGQEVGGPEGTGFFAVLQRELKEINEVLRSPEVINFARNLGEALKSMVPDLSALLQGAISLVTKLMEMKDVLLVIAGIFAVKLLGGAGASAIAAFTALKLALGNVSKEMLTLRTNAQVAANAQHTFFVNSKGAAVSAASLAGGLNTASTSMRVFGVATKGAGIAVRALFGPVGMLISTVAILATTFLNLADDSDTAFEAIKNGNEILDRQDEANRRLILSTRKLGLEQERQRIRSGELMDVNTGFTSKDVDNRLQEIDKELAEVAAAEIENEKAITRFVKRESEQRARIWRESIDDRARTIRTTFVKAADELQTQLSDGLITEEEMQKERTKIVREEALAQIAIREEAIKKLQGVSLFAETEEEARGAQLAWAAFMEEILKYREIAANADKFGIPTVAGAADKAATAATTKLTELRGRIADLRAELQGNNGELEKMEVILSSDKFKNLPIAEKDKLRAAAALLDTLTDKVKAYRTQVAAVKSAWKSLDTFREKANTGLEESMRKLANFGTFGFSESLLNQLAQMERRFKGIKEGMPDEEAKKFREELEKIAQTAKRKELVDALIEIKENTQGISRELMNEEDAARDAYQTELDFLEHIRKKLIEQKLLTDDNKKTLDDYAEVLKQKLARDTETAIDAMMRSWEDAVKRMDDKAAEWINSMTDELTEFVMTGKADFKSLADSIIRDIIRISIQAALANIYKSIFGESGGGSFFGDLVGGFVSAFTGGGGSDFTSAGAAGSGDIVMEVLHSGGVAGSGANTFRVASQELLKGARRMHTGGMVGSGEVPTILKKGEGVFTKEQMQAMGGAPNVQVNVINQTGQQIAAEDGQQRFDGETLVKDIVLRNALKPGPFRDNLKEALKT